MVRREGQFNQQEGYEILPENVANDIVEKIEANLVSLAITYKNELALYAEDHPNLIDVTLNDFNISLPSNEYALRTF